MKKETPKNVSMGIREEEPDETLLEEYKNKAVEIAKMAESMEKLGYDKERIKRRVRKMVGEELHEIKDKFMETTVNSFRTELERLHKEIAEAEKSGNHEAVEKAVEKYNKTKSEYNEKLKTCGAELRNKRNCFKNNVFSKFNI